MRDKHIIVHFSGFFIEIKKFRFSLKTTRNWRLYVFNKLTNLKNQRYVGILMYLFKKITLFVEIKKVKISTKRNDCRNLPYTAPVRLASLWDMGGRRGVIFADRRVSQLYKQARFYVFNHSIPSSLGKHICFVGCLEFLWNLQHARNRLTPPLLPEAPP